MARVETSFIRNPVSENVNAMAEPFQEQTEPCVAVSQEPLVARPNGVLLALRHGMVLIVPSESQSREVEVAVNRASGGERIKGGGRQKLCSHRKGASVKSDIAGRGSAEGEGPDVEGAGDGKEGQGKRRCGEWRRDEKGVVWWREQGQGGGAARGLRGAISKMTDDRNTRRREKKKQFRGNMSVLVEENISAGAEGPRREVESELTLAAEIQASQLATSASFITSLKRNPGPHAPVYVYTELILSHKPFREGGTSPHVGRYLEGACGWTNVGQESMAGSAMACQLSGGEAGGDGVASS
ncbi:hypothetical protein FPV67DRAFT_1459761 [Lyophyllum atratum]|nr:hypothetical protein FPV67DRAFT_1459761 [Lyophyllum atratum]